MNSLKGKVAIVLGASAEGGSGWAIAEALADVGAKVVVSARSEEPLKKLAAKIGGTAVACDIADEAQVKNLADVAVKTYGALHIAVNSAGLPQFGFIAESNDAQLQAAISVNYFGNVYFIKHMSEAIGSDGSIVIISSLSTTHPVFPHFAYACAKSATDCLVRYAALEYGPRNIRINSILPGSIVSDLSKEFFANPEVTKTFENEVPLRRLGYPQDMANAVLWLAGPAFVTGLNLPVSGGNQLTRFPFLSELPAAEHAYDGSGTPLFDRK